MGFVLGRLPGGWYAFHDVSVGERGANIDHVIVGPGGVFTLNSRNPTGMIWVGPRSILHNGHRTDFLPKEARIAQGLVTPPTAPRQPADSIRRVRSRGDVSEFVAEQRR